MTLAQFFKCLSDETRLNTCLLIQREGELSVCELVAALDDHQSKVSRHLGHLRNAGVLTDERRGMRVYYRLHPRLADWALRILKEAGAARESVLRAYCDRLGERAMAS